MPANATHAELAPQARHELVARVGMFASRIVVDASLPGWIRARDRLAGEDAVKAAGAKYLPRLDGQTDEDYLA